MAKKLRIDSIAKSNLEKPIIKPRAPNIVSKQDKGLRQALEERIERDIPESMLTGGNPFYPTEIQKRMVWQMAAMGASQKIIQLAIIDSRTRQPIPEHTLVAYFGDIMRHAREQANFTVALKIYEIAIGHDAELDGEGNLIRPFMPPNLEALKWWDRSRGEARKLLELRSRTIDAESANTVTLVIEGS